MPGPIFAIERFVADNPDAVEFRAVPAANVHIAQLDPASLTRYGSGAREHPGAPPPRPDERPWVGKSKGRKR